jgi:prepilin-type N-terminal cleavage/methylation domain-containing protein
MKARRLGSRDGFTLVEIIVALVLIAIAGAILTTLISRTAIRMNRPRVQLREAFALQAVMENLVAHHKDLDDLALLSDQIGDEGADVANQFGSYQVVDNHLVTFDGDDAEVASATNSLLKVSIRNPLGETLSRLFTENI